MATGTKRTLAGGTPMTDRELDGQVDDVLMGVIDQAKDLERQGRGCEALDVVYDAFDDWFLAGEFDKADALLPQIDVRSCPTDILLTVLTASGHARPNLKNRAAFFEAVRAEMVARNETDPTLLSGLE